MVQGKNNELQPLVNRRKGYPQPSMVYQQKAQKPVEAGYSSPNPYVEDVHYNPGTPAFGEKLVSSQDEEMNNEYSHDIQMKIKRTSPKDTISKMVKANPLDRVTVSAFEPFPT